MEQQMSGGGGQSFAQQGSWGHGGSGGYGIFSRQQGHGYGGYVAWHSHHRCFDFFVNNTQYLLVWYLNSESLISRDCIQLYQVSDSTTKSEKRHLPVSHGKLFLVQKCWLFGVSMLRCSKDQRYRAHSVPILHVYFVQEALESIIATWTSIPLTRVWIAHVCFNLSANISISLSSSEPDFEHKGLHLEHKQ